MKKRISFRPGVMVLFGLGILILLIMACQTAGFMPTPQPTLSDVHVDGGLSEIEKATLEAQWEYMSSQHNDSERQAVLRLVAPNPQLSEFRNNIPVELVVLPDETQRVYLQYDSTNSGFASITAGSDTVNLRGSTLGFELFVLNSGQIISASNATGQWAIENIGILNAPFAISLGAVTVGADFGNNPFLSVQPTAVITDSVLPNIVSMAPENTRIYPLGEMQSAIPAMVNCGDQTCNMLQDKFTTFGVFIPDSAHVSATYNPEGLWCFGNLSCLAAPFTLDFGKVYVGVDETNYPFIASK